MKKVFEALSWLTLFLLLIFVLGCSTYYAVRDPHSGTTYYTMEITEAKAGTIKFTDAKTKLAVTIYDPEVKRLDSSEYNAALIASPASPVSKVKPVGISNRDESY